MADASQELVADQGVVMQGWQCSDCGWGTTDLAVMSQALWPEAGGVVSLVCPGCHAEGSFVDLDLEPAPEDRRADRG